MSLSRLALSSLVAALLMGTALSAMPQSARADGWQLEQVPLSTQYGVVNGAADNGTLVGEQYDSPFLSEPYYWTADGVAHIVPGLSGIDSLATGISGDGGTIIGTLSHSPSQAFAYHIGDSSISTLQGLGGDSRATGVVPDGSEIVGYSRPAANSAVQPIVWSGPGWTMMTILPSDTNSSTYANGISDDGSVVVGYQNGVGPQRGLYWTNGGAPVQLTTGTLSSQATAISGDGSTIIGISAPGNTVYRATAWSGPQFTTQIDLGSLGGDYSAANGVNRDGSIIVGESQLAGDTQEHAFLYSNGTMKDLNTLLTESGVDMSSTVLTTAAGISPNGKYIAADVQDSVPYLVYYDDGSGQAALTNQAEQQASVDALARSRQGIAIGSDAYFGVLAGDLDRVEPSNMVGVFGLVGSAVGGARGRIASGNGWTINAGLADGSSEFGDAGIGGGLLAAVSLRYDAGDFAPGSFHPFGEAGASGGLLSGISLTRSYAGGIGHGSTSGSLADIHIRAGVSGELLNGDQVTLDAELGESWLTTAAYDEAADASNPFPASIAAGTQSLTVAKLGGSLSHKLSEKVDLTLHAALAQTLGGSSGLTVATTGFGTLTGDAGSASWLEAGAHLSWAVTDTGAIDLYATGTTGGNATATGHVGAGYHLSF